MAKLYSRIKTYLDANLTLSDFKVIDGRVERGAKTANLFIILPGAAALLNIVANDEELGRDFDWGVTIECEPTSGKTPEENLELAMEDLTPQIIAYSDTNKRWQPIQVGTTDIRVGVASATYGVIERTEMETDDW